MSVKVPFAFFFPPHFSCVPPFPFPPFPRPPNPFFSRLSLSPPPLFQGPDRATSPFFFFSLGSFFSLPSLYPLCFFSAVSAPLRTLPRFTPLPSAVRLPGLIPCKRCFPWADSFLVTPHLVSSLQVFSFPGDLWVRGGSPFSTAPTIRKPRILARSIIFSFFRTLSPPVSVYLFHSPATKSTYFLFLASGQFFSPPVFF